VAVLFGWFFVDLTQWSLHPYYRRRLSRAFFVRRTTAEEQEHGAGAVTELPFNQPLHFSRLDTKGRFPQLVVCAAANLSDEGVTPPGRNAASFTFSRDEIGGMAVGLLETETFERRVKGQGGFGTAARDVTLPAAVAMSGAAVSPSMGKHSIRALTFLLGLTNVRLGVWLPNPRWLDELAKHRRGSSGHLRPPPWYLIHELLGRNKANHKYLYISDGGHFENLGLIELLRRGCTTVFCFDASGDRADSFNDVEVEPQGIAPDPKTGWSATDHVLGTLRFLNPGRHADGTPRRDDGLLVFAKAAVTEDAPWDVKAFREADKRFPNHSTFDQLFDDRKFESYRALGAHTARRAIRTWMRQVSQDTVAGVLKDVARARTQITYAQLVERTNGQVPEAVRPPPDLKPLLREIDAQEVAGNRPPLSIVITDESLGNGDSPLLAGVDGQLTRAWDHWSATPLPREELSGERPGGQPQPPQ
jgi:hypothetical protein